MFFFAFEKVSMHVAISCPTIHIDNLTHCYQFIPVSYSSIVLVLLNNIIKKKTYELNLRLYRETEYRVEKTVDTHKILINAITCYVCLQEI